MLRTGKTEHYGREASPGHGTGISRETGQLSCALIPKLSGLTDRTKLV